MCIASTVTNPKGTYYALVKTQGKQVRKSLETADKATATRKFADFQRDLGKVDSSQGRLTLRELCKRYLDTIANRSKKNRGDQKGCGSAVVG